VLATTLYAESLDRAYDQHFTHLVASALLGLAGVAATSGRPEVGAHLLGASEGLMEALGAPVFPRDHPVRARCLAALTALLGDARLAAAREAGRTLPVAQAVAAAKAVAEAVAKSALAERD
jgi:hypothetical protein